MAQGSIQVTAPTFDHYDPESKFLGIGNATPRISWSFDSQYSDNDIGWEQESYEVQIDFENSDITSQSTDSVNTFQIDGTSSVCVPWPARPLKSKEAARVRVRSHGSNAASRRSSKVTSPTSWSPWRRLETALLEPSDWKASWINPTYSSKNEDGSLKPIRLAKSFKLPSQGSITKARLYITARGCYHAQINDVDVGDQCMAPGWQSYKHRLHYQTFDVTQLLQGNGETNVIDVNVAPGWYASALAWAGGRRCFFGDELSLLAQLEVTFSNNTEPTTILTDDSWTTIVHNHIISSEIYAGETYNMINTSKTSLTDLNNSNTRPTKIINPPKAKLISPEAGPVRVIEEIKPTNIFRSPSNKVLIDFGQNLVGRLRIKSLQKPAGTNVIFSHAEVLEHGELGVRPLREAKATDTIICNSTVLENWTPKFTFHGFRYVEVSGWSPEDESCPLTTDSLVAQVMHTSMKRTGTFECSNPLVNQLHRNAVWSMKGNFLSIPSDCPQRDERLGWTGDIQVFGPTASFLYDTTGMLGNWLEDLAAEQLDPDNKAPGAPPFVVPDVITKFDENDTHYWPALPNAVWDDVAVLLPWTLYEASGDPEVLRRQYPSMKAWLDQGVKRGPDNLWDEFVFQLGDWLDPLAPPSEPGNGKTDPTLVADAYLVHVTRIMARASEALNERDNAQRYQKDHESLLKTFRARYITSQGLIIGDTQTALALAISFDLFESPSHLSTAGARLARSVKMQQFRVATGFAGTPLILHALTKSGQPDIAYRMLLEQRCPSWMYAVLMGSTTIWERWDSMLPDGSINPGEMTSFNHYALGSVADWLHRTVGGLAPLEPGWKTVMVRPVPGGEMTHANLAFESPQGRISCVWKLEGDRFNMVLEVPPNAKACIVLPDGSGKGNEEAGQWVGHGRHEFDCKFEASVWPPEAIMSPFWPQALPQC